MTETLLTVLEAADLLGVSSKTVYRLIGTGDIPAIRIGPTRTLRISDADLSRLVASWKVAGNRHD